MTTEILLLKQKEPERGGVSLVEITTKGVGEQHFLTPDMAKKFLKMMSSSNEMKHTGKDITVGEFMDILAYLRTEGWRCTTSNAYLDNAKNTVIRTFYFESVESSSSTTSSTKSNESDEEDDGIMKDVGSDEENEDDNKMPQNSSPKEVPSPHHSSTDKIVPNDSLPPGWYEEFDEEGNTYYYNELTDESSWERPVMSLEESEVEKKREEEEKLQKEKEKKARAKIAAAEEKRKREEQEARVRKEKEEQEARVRKEKEEQEARIKKEQEE
jgi:hypothetical protein